MKKKVIIAKDLYPAITGIMEVLGRSDIEVHTAGGHEEMIALHFEHKARLLVTRPDLPGMNYDAFVTIIRRNDALRNVSILLVVPTEQSLSVAPGNNGNGVAVLSHPDAVGGKIKELLDVQPRRSYRVIMNIAVDGKLGGSTFMGQIENISAHGILVRTSELLEQGSLINFSFYLPDGKRISAGGDIVRVERSGSPQYKYGVHFLKLTPEDKSAIVLFVEQQARSQGRPPDESDSAVA